MTKNNHPRYAATTNDPNDSGDFQTTQIQSLEKVSDAFVVWPYGFGGSAPNGSFAVLVPINGQEDMLAAIVCDPKNRIKGLQPGEVFMHSPASGSSIVMKQNGDVEVTGKNDYTATFDKDFNITINGSANIKANGSVTIDGDDGVNLGSAASQGIARQGDSVQVIISGTPYSGTITGGSSKNKSE